MGRALLLRARRSDFRLSRPRPPGIPQRELAPDGEEMAPVMEPQEIEDAEHEQILERVAAVDVGKASGMVCTRVPHDARPGKRRTRVWEVSATTGAVLELADHLVAEGIERVSLESTSDYWRIWFYVFEAAGLNVQLVNAHDVKNAPGRPKTDLLTELPDVAAAQEAQPSPWPIVGVSERSRSPGRGGHVASLIATETGHTVLNHLPGLLLAADL